VTSFDSEARVGVNRQDMVEDSTKHWLSRKEDNFNAGRDTRDVKSDERNPLEG